MKGRSVVYIMASYKSSCLFKYFCFSDEERRMRDEVLQEFRLFDKSRMFTTRFFSIMEKMPLASLFSMLPTHTGTVVYDGAMCIACYSIIDALLVYSQTHSHQDLRNLLYSMCTNLGILGDKICAGVIDLNMVIEIHLENL
jgi:hypothetical protein